MKGSIESPRKSENSKMEMNAEMPKEQQKHSSMKIKESSMKIKDVQNKPFNQRSDTQLTKIEKSRSAIKKVEDSDENYEEEQYASA